MLLELPWFRISHALIASSVLMLSAHLSFLVHSTGSRVPLCMLGMGQALWRTAFGPGLALSLQNGTENSAQHTHSLLEGSTVETSGPNNANGRDDASRACEASVYSPGNKDRSLLTPVGFGLASSTLNLAVGIVTNVVPLIESKAGFSGLELTFASLSLLALVACIMFAWSWKSA
jgi:hypothetical protein